MDWILALKVLIVAAAAAAAVTAATAAAATLYLLLQLLKSRLSVAAIFAVKTECSCHYCSYH